MLDFFFFPAAGVRTPDVGGRPIRGVASPPRGVAAPFFFLPNRSNRSDRVLFGVSTGRPPRGASDGPVPAGLPGERETPTTLAAALVPTEAAEEAAPGLRGTSSSVAAREDGAAGVVSWAAAPPRGVRPLRRPLPRGVPSWKPASESGERGEMAALLVAMRCLARSLLRWAAEPSRKTEPAL